MKTDDRFAPIEAEETFGGVRYRFPRAPGGGCIRVFGLPFALFGAVFLALPWLTLAVAIWVAVTQGLGGEFLILLLGAMMFGVFSLIGLVPFGIGMHIMAGSSELELSDDVLISRIGWWRLRRTYRRQVAAVTRFVLTNPLSATPRGGSQYVRGPDGRLLDAREQRKRLERFKEFGLAANERIAGLEIHCEGERPLMAAWGQSPDGLRAVAQDLARRCNRPIEDRVGTGPIDE